MQVYWLQFETDLLGDASPLKQLYLNPPGGELSSERQETLTSLIHSGMMLTAGLRVGVL